MKNMLSGSLFQGNIKAITLPELNHIKKIPTSDWMKWATNKDLLLSYSMCWHIPVIFVPNTPSQLQPQLRQQEAGQQNVEYFVRFISYKHENPVQRISVADGEGLLKAFFELINSILTAVEPMQDTLHSLAESNLGSIHALSLKSNIEISFRTAAEQTDKDDEDY